MTGSFRRSSARSSTPRFGRLSVTDGPYVETKELLGARLAHEREPADPGGRPGTREHRSSEDGPPRPDGDPSSVVDYRGPVRLLATYPSRLQPGPKTAK